MIHIHNISKAYKRYSHKYGRMAEWLGLGRYHEDIWVLREISLDVAQGQAVGIVGVNGAGKSTLLKIITGTTRPTNGTVQVGGRISALLERGMGFHPEFTGRQNCYVSGQLHGLRSREIEELISEIADFAEIGDYFDQPVRTYSSGMQVRLAFALATAKRPEVLIVDEALSVGDAAFQRKCFQRIESFRAKETTLLFVSHSVETVKLLCGQAVFLDQGLVKMAGQAKDVCDAYEKHLFGGRAAMSVPADIEKPKGHLDSSLTATSIEKQYGDGGACITSVQIETDSGNIANVIPEGVKFYVTYTVNFLRECRGVKFGMMIKTVEGVPVYGTNTTGWASQQDFDCGQKASVRFALEGNLMPGTYYLNVGMNHETALSMQCLHRRVDCLIFCVTCDHNRTSIGYANVFATPSVELARPKNSAVMKG